VYTGAGSFFTIITNIFDIAIDTGTDGFITGHLINFTVNDVTRFEVDVAGNVDIAGDIEAGGDLDLTGANTVFNITDGYYIAAAGQPKFRAYLSTDILNVEGNNQTKVVFDMETFDIGNIYNPVTGRFTAKVAGYYQINVGIRFRDVVAPRLYYVFVKKNGVDYSTSYAHSSFAQVVSGGGPLSDLVYMDINDYIEVFAISSNIADTSDIDGSAGGQLTFFSAHLLS
jgi:hypothetical protein